MIVWKNGSHENTICRSSTQPSAIKTNLLTSRSVKLWEINLKVCDFVKTFSTILGPLNMNVCVFQIDGNSQLTCLLPEPDSLSQLIMLISEEILKYLKEQV